MPDSSSPPVESGARVRSATRSFRAGWGHAPCHFGELFQGADRSPENGKQRVCLVTLRCPQAGSRSTFQPEYGAALRVEPADKSKSLRAARTTLDLLDCQGIGGLLTVHTETAEARGYGSSTSDCLAAIYSVCDAFGARIAPGVEAEILYRAEGASDPLMYEDVIFLSRLGQVLEYFPRRLPALEVLGFDTRPRGPGVLTDQCPHPCYDDHELELFQFMMGALRWAAQHQDGRLLARVATESAKINQRYLKKDAFEDWERIAGEAGALGYVVAHTGTLGGFLYDPRRAGLEREKEWAREQLQALGFGSFMRFLSSDDWEARAHAVA